MERIQALVPATHEMTVYDTMAKHAVQSKFYKNFGDAAAVMAIMLSARELGITPMAALNGGLNIIQGKVEISARMMNALIRRAGHSINTITCTDTECELKGRRADNGDECTATFTMEDAKKAQLIKPGGGWIKYPSDMLYARTLSRLARRLFPDVIGCAYVEGEIVDSGANKVPSQQHLEEAENVEVTEDPFPDDFLKRFDTDEQMFMQEYIKLVHEKYNHTYHEIVEKFQTNETDFMSKFEKWKKQHVSKRGE